MPYLLQQYRARRLKLIPILWRPCDWRAIPWLSDLRPLPISGAAIAPHARGQHDQLWAEIAQQLDGRGIPAGWPATSTPGTNILVPSRTTLIARSQNLLATTKADCEKVVDVTLGIHQLPQLVQARHVPHVRASEDEMARPLREDLLDYLLQVEKLLLLGLPGAGKTQTLRMLWERLLQEAQVDQKLPVAFLINLSTFSTYPGTLRDWLAEALKECAAIPVAIGQALLAGGHLFLLLDGLDEMAAERRSAALSELNALIDAADPALARCVLCSRTLEYAAADVPLLLPSALELQPLRPEQVYSAVERARASAAALATALTRDVALAALLATPLMLSVAVRAFAGVPEVALYGYSPASARQTLYDAYVVQMLRRTAGLHSATPTLCWLRWLALHLRREQSSLFLIEKLQPAALPTQRHYKILVGLGVGLGTALIVGLVAGLGRGENFGLFQGVFSGLLGGLSYGITASSIDPVAQLHWSGAQAGKKWRRLLGMSLGMTLFAGFCFGLSRHPTAGAISGICIGLLSGLFMFIFSGLVKSTNEQSIQPNQAIRSSVRLGTWLGIIGGSAFGFSISLVFRIGIGQYFNFWHTLTMVLYFVLAGWRVGSAPFGWS